MLQQHHSCCCSATWYSEPAFVKPLMCPCLSAKKTMQNFIYIKNLACELCITFLKTGIGSKFSISAAAFLMPHAETALQCCCSAVTLAVLSRQLQHCCSCSGCTLQCILHFNDFAGAVCNHIAVYCYTEAITVAELHFGCLQSQEVQLLCIASFLPMFCMYPGGRCGIINTQPADLYSIIRLYHYELKVYTGLWLILPQQK